MNLGTLLLDAWTRAGRAPVIVDDQASWSGERLLAASEAMVGEIRRRGPGANEPIGVRMSNRPEDFAAMAAVWAAGGVVVPIHRTAPAGAVEQIVAATGLRLLVEALRQGGQVELLSSPPPPPDRLLGGAATIVFTSGSSGQPKGVVLSHRALADKLEANRTVLGFAAEERVLLVLQTTFSFGFWVSMLTILTGGVLSVRGRFEIASVLGEIAGGGIQRTAMVPTMLRAIQAAKKEAPIARLLATIRRRHRLHHLYTGGEILTPPLAASTRRAFGQTVLHNIFGLTETATSDFFLSGDDLAENPGAIGRPGPGVDYRIVDQTGSSVGEGDVGELQIRTRTIMNGYLGQPQETAASFAEGGFFRTGDLARQQPNGIVSVVGRAKEVISRGGNKVYPQEVELAVQSHPGVGSALVTGVPDQLMGERIHLAVVPAPGAAPNPDELRAWAARRLEKFKLPDAIHLVPELPAGRTGKTDRGQLKSLLIASGRTLGTGSR